MLRFTKIIVMASLTTAAMTGNAVAQDLRSPDARDAARSTTHAIDLRSPDARDAARSTTYAIDLRSPDGRESAGGPSMSDVAQSAAVQDLQSPDARDGGNVTTYTPGVTSVPRVYSIPTSGFEWGDAGIGAAAMLGLIALCGGMLLVVSSRRRDRRLPRAIG